MRPDEIEKIKTEIREIRSFGLSYKKRYGPKNAVYKTCHKAAKRIDSLLKELMARMRDKNDAACDMYAIGELAVEKLMEQSMASGGRLIIKEGN